LNERAVNCVNGSSPTIRDNWILDNATPCIVLFQSRAVITDNTILGNPAALQDAVLCSQSAPTIVGNFIDGSDPSGNFSAVYLLYTNLDMTESFLVERNHILGRIYLDSISSHHALDNVVRNNLLLNTLGYPEAIGIAFSQSAGDALRQHLDRWRRHPDARRVDRHDHWSIWPTAAQESATTAAPRPFSTTMSSATTNYQGSRTRRDQRQHLGRSAVRGRGRRRLPAQAASPCIDAGIHSLILRAWIAPACRAGSMEISTGP
jgi:hypothetical protein